MTTLHLRAALCAGLLFAPLAAAQTVTRVNPDGSTQTIPPGGAAPMVVPPPAMQPVQTPLPPPPFDRLAKLGPDRKIIRVDGILDILAIPRNKLVDQATRDRIRPLVQAWMADVDQLVIDNLDFIEKIEPPDGSQSVIDSVDLQNQKRLLYVTQMMTQLMSAGLLTPYLETKEGFNRAQAELNQQIVNDYLQQVMNEVMAENGVPNDINQRPQDETAKLKQANAVSRFLYRLSCRDAIESYHRQLEHGAQHMEQATASLQLAPEQQAKLKPAVAAAKSASTPEAKRKATRAVLDLLTFDQRREVLARARDLAPPYDPVAELPPYQPPAPAAAAQPAPAQPKGN